MTDTTLGASGDLNRPAARPAGLGTPPAAAGEVRSTRVPAADDEDLKACCARTYQQDVVALILGESYHPGGVDLTRRLACTLDIRKGHRVLDVASGPGTTAFLLATEFGAEVDGVDLGEQSVAKANAKAAEKGLDTQVRFHVGDAERLPFPDAAFDVVVSECAFCTFPDKPTAAAEMARVLKPGGKVGITDVALDKNRLHEELRSLSGWVACLADARPLDEYISILETAGLRTTHTESHDDGLAAMIQQIDDRLVAFKIVKLPALEDIDFDLARRRTALAAQAVRDGIAGYKLLVAQKG